MKLEVLQQNFSKALAISSRFVNTRAQIPILSNILLLAAKNKFLVQATNLEISCSISIGAKVSKEGSLAIPSKTIVDLVSNLSQESITLEVEKEQIKVTSSGFSASVNGINPSDFPIIPQNLDATSGELSSDLFIKSLSQVLFCASNDETRPVLTGVLFLFKDNLLTLVATDGFRLSQKQVPIRTKAKSIKKDSLIIPKTVLSEVLRISDEANEPILFQFKDTENQILFALDQMVLASRVIEGEFPNFEKIIPKNSTVKVNLDKDDLLRAVKLSAVFARDNANIVKFSINQNSLKLSAESTKSGKQETQVEAKVEGEDLEILFNYRFVEEFLNVVVGEEVNMEFSTSSSPGVFKDPKDANFLHLIMPVRISSNE